MLSRLYRGVPFVCRRYTTESPETRLRRLANLGSTTRRLEDAVPCLLRNQLPPDLIHPTIKFIVFPETHWLEVTGSTAYRTSTKLIQLAITTLLLPTSTQLYILSMRMDEAQQICDRHLHINWRTVSPDREPPPAENAQHIWEPGRLIESLGVLLPDEYPVLAGSFEFGFTDECSQIDLHILRNVEYMSRPDSQLICP